jgi:HAD superfamily hydrolase (TIGR01490 family)
MAGSAAFFDLDRTLIAGSATFPLAVAAFAEGLVRPRDLAGDAVNALTFLVRGADDARSEALRERILRGVAGAEADQVRRMGRRIVPQLADSVLPEARQALADHARAGEDRIIISASPQELVEELAEALGLEGAIGTVGEVVDGRYTGRLARPFCYGAQKPIEAARLASERGYDLARSSAYSDSISDRPLLEAVGHPVAVNPDRELRELARQRTWRVLEVRPQRNRIAAAISETVALLRPPLKAQAPPA